jgi:hypothetical protein
MRIIFHTFSRKSIGYHAWKDGTIAAERYKYVIGLGFMTIHIKNYRGSK